ncbi:MAG: tautomerase family protein [Methylovulum sp.]|nr:MAG: tautomerase family protein [Methylovulum sp.]
MEAMHRTLRKAFKIVPGDKNVRLLVHDPIALPADRTLDAKRNLYRTIAANLEPSGIPKDHVKILLREIAKENWGIRGGQAGCDVDLGFKIGLAHPSSLIHSLFSHCCQTNQFTFRLQGDQQCGL